MSFQVRYDNHAMKKTRSGAIWGPIWIALDGDDFPEENWNDMPVALAGEFAAALRRLKIGSAEIVRFFDGPLSVRFRRTTPRLVEVSLDGGRVRSDLAGTVDFDELLMTVQGAVSDIYLGCIKFGWAENDDVRRLKSYMIP
jgi:hypothetical protein